MDTETIKYLAAGAILAFVAYLAFSRKDLLLKKTPFTSEKKIFLILIILVPIVLAGLYVMKYSNNGYRNYQQPIDNQQIPNILPREEKNKGYDAPSYREEGVKI